VLAGCSFGPTGAERLKAAKTAYDKGDFARSAEQLKGLVESDAGNLDARAQLALVLAAMGDNKGAIAQYTAILERDPKNVAALYRLAVIERIVGRPAQASTHFQRALEVKPTDAKLLDEAARTKMILGDFKGAASLWGKVLESPKVPPPLRKKILLLQGEAYQDARAYGSAKASFLAALKLDPRDRALEARIKSFQ
jgi:tetratricopeptide (TPR) repeat protein